MWRPFYTRPGGRVGRAVTMVNGFIVRSLRNVVKDEDERALRWREL